MSEKWSGPLIKIDEYRYKVPRDYKKEMRTDGIIYASEKLIKQVVLDQAPEQVANVATLPGIVGYSLAMPDIHWGYGFPIGGVCASSYEQGIISPGGVGYDINCGVRVIRTNLTYDEIKNKLEELSTALYHNVPSGVGSEGKIKVTRSELDKVLEQGARWAVEKGFGTKEDLEVTEEGGCIEGASQEVVSNRAKERGLPQLGSLGSGNHFLEIQKVEEIYDENIANILGIFPDQILVMIHTGSRGLGYQVCDDYIIVMRKAAEKYNIRLVDKQLCCAPINSEEGKQYFAAMKAAANYAWCNRQFIVHWIREAFEKVLKLSSERLGLEQIYDVAHNIAKLEEYQGKKVIVHRKGATRAFGPHHKDIPEKYKEIGQPVIIPGDMGTYSYILVGTKKAEEESFGSTCHGAGRVMSREAAKKRLSLPKLLEELKKENIIVRSASKGTLLEEAPQAYKDISDVVNSCHGSGISKKVVKMRPLAVVKG